MSDPVLGDERFDAMIFNMEPDEALEVRLGGLSTQYVYTGSRTPSGLIHHHLCYKGVGVSESLSNLQMEVTVPSKAVKGWQVEMVRALRSGLYDVTEVR